MKKTLIAAAAAVLAFTSAPAMAQNADYRQYKQDQRIDRGVHSGELTRAEARNLYRQQDRIDRYEDRALRDGRLSYRERQKLDRKQDRASDRIYRKKHNDRAYW